MLKWIYEQKTLMNLIPFIFVIVGLFLVYANVQSSANKADSARESGKAVRVYSISTNCFLAVPADQRTDSYIDSCYDKAESIVGAKVERFGYVQ